MKALNVTAAVLNSSPPNALPGWNCLPFSCEVYSTTDLSSRAQKTWWIQTEKTMYSLSCYNPGSFILAGIPGLEKFHVWIGIPFVPSMFWLLWAWHLLPPRVVEDSLHEPMFFFLSPAGHPRTSSCLLPAVTQTAPVTSGLAPETKLLAVSPKCSSSLQLCSEQPSLLTMALDRYVAICFPLGIHQRPGSSGDYQACGGHCREEFLGHLARCLSAEAVALLRNHESSPTHTA